MCIVQFKQLMLLPYGETMRVIRHNIRNIYYGQY